MRMIVAFEKTEQVRHIGHLDLMRSMQRALRRSGLPIKYSQGFNPHVVLSFASPLPVGASGAEELMDVAMQADVSIEDFAAQLTPAMADSLPLVRVRIVDDKHPALMAQLKTAEYVALLPQCAETETMAQAIESMLAMEEIIAIRKTKSGEKPCDIRPMIHMLKQCDDGNMNRITFRTSLTEKETLKPDLLLRTLASQAGVDLPQVRLRRIKLYGEQDRLPVPLMEM